PDGAQLPVRQQPDVLARLATRPERARSRADLPGAQLRPRGDGARPRRLSCPPPAQGRRGRYLAAIFAVCRRRSASRASAEAQARALPATWESSASASPPPTLPRRRTAAFRTAQEVRPSKR